MLGSLPAQIAAQAMDIDEILIENTGESLGEVMKRQFGQDRLASQALGQRLNEQAMPSAPAPQSGVGLDQLRDAWNPNMQASPEAVAELEEIIWGKKDYEQSRDPTNQIKSLLESGNDQDYLAGLSMLEAAEQALANEAINQGDVGQRPPRRSVSSALSGVDPTVVQQPLTAEGRAGVEDEVNRLVDLGRIEEAEALWGTMQRILGRQTWQ